jgi:hypothetical protein
MAATSPAVPTISRSAAAWDQMRVRDQAYELERAAYAAMRAGVHDQFPDGLLPPDAVLTEEQQQLIREHDDARTLLRAARGQVVKLPD